MSGLRIGPQLMDGLSAGHSPPRSKEEEEESDIYIHLFTVYFIFYTTTVTVKI